MSRILRHPSTRGRTWCALLCLAALAFPPAVRADGISIIRECQAGTLGERTHPDRDYADALRDLGGDVDEYSDCRDQIQAARLKAIADRNRGNTPSARADQTVRRMAEILTADQPAAANPTKERAAEVASLLSTAPDAAPLPGLVTAQGVPAVAPAGNGGTSPVVPLIALLAAGAGTGLAALRRSGAVGL